MSMLRNERPDLTGARRSILAGDLVTMDAAGRVVRGGRLCLQDAAIVAMLDPGDPLPAGFQGVDVLETGGTLYPGLVELHNHLTYNYLPLWTVPARYTNRNQWRTQEPTYEDDIAEPQRILSRNVDKDYLRSICRYSECRSLFGGTTTSQGISASSSSGERVYYAGLVRNVEQPLIAGWPQAGGQTLDYDPPSDVRTKLVPALAKGLPFFYHLSEGTDGDARQRFLDLEYQAGAWAIEPNLICIHAAACRPGDFARLTRAAGVVWSPLSNLLLYGATADVAAAADAGVSLALGSDWSPSGSKNLLGELKVAKILSDRLARPFSDEALVRMVTSAPARMLQWDAMIGTLEPGKAADVLVIAGTDENPYAPLLAAQEDDILLVLIGGRVRHGDAQLVTPNLEGQEPVMIGGRTYLLDLDDPDAGPMNGLTFATARAKLIYGLAHLPELARQHVVARGLALVDDGSPDWTLDLEFEPPPDRRSIFEAAAKFELSRLKPMKLEPPTAVDDPAFYDRLRANINLPQAVREALP